jgi:hypothetical protein
VNSLAARVFGVIRRPRATFAVIVQTPSWVSVLILTTVVIFVSAMAFLNTDIGRQALVDQWERTATAFGQSVDDGAYARMEERAAGGEIGLLYGVTTALAFGPALASVVSGLLFLALKPRHPFSQVLAVVAHAGIILALRQVVAAPINYLRESIASPTTLVQFFGMFDEASPVARFLGVIDLFVVWWIVVLAIGASVLYRRPTRSLALTFTGVYVVLALLAALIMAVSGGTA